MGAIIGIAAGGGLVALIILVLLLACCCWCCYRSSHKVSYDINYSHQNPANPTGLVVRRYDQHAVHPTFDHQNSGGGSLRGSRRSRSSIRSSISSIASRLSLRRGGKGGGKDKDELLQDPMMVSAV